MFLCRVVMVVFGWVGESGGVRSLWEDGEGLGCGIRDTSVRLRVRLDRLGRWAGCKVGDSSHLLPDRPEL